MKHILFDYKVYLLEFICFNITVICCHFIEQTSTKLFVLPNTAAAVYQQQHGSSCCCQQQYGSSSIPMREGVRACRNTRAAPVHGKWRLLVNMFRKLLGRIFPLI